jgi:hypothetical protein
LQTARRLGAEREPTYSYSIRMDPVPRRQIAWQESPGMLAWPYDWQRPARTEEWAFAGGSQAVERSRFAQLVCFPWATLVDLLDRGRLDRARPLLDAIRHAPPRSHLIRATVCQHVRISTLLPWLKSLQVSDVFWAHACTNQPTLEGIRLHPFPLYPVRALEPSGQASQPPAVSRRYLYSFIGAYRPDGYLTPVRKWIADLPRDDHSYVKLRDQWHYESPVYEQIARKDTPPDVRAKMDLQAHEYDRIMLESIFALCPSGSGPNSIRLWESLGFGCIPVLLSDHLRLPGDSAEWDEAIVRAAETSDAVAALPSRLAAIAADPGRVWRMQQAGRRLWDRYGLNGPATVLSVLSTRDWIRSQIGAAPFAVPPADVNTPTNLA